MLLLKLIRINRLDSHLAGEGYPNYKVALLIGVCRFISQHGGKHPGLIRHEDYKDIASLHVQIDSADLDAVYISVPNIKLLNIKSLNTNPYLEFIHHQGNVCRP